MLVVLPLTAWTWRVALSGYTSEESARNMFKKNKDESHKYDDVIQQHDYQLEQYVRTYKIDDWRENVFIIFGTWNLAGALLMPKERILPLRGLEWSFMELNEGGRSPLDRGII